MLRDSAERDDVDILSDDASRNVDLLEAAFGGGELIEPKRGGEAESAGTTPVQRSSVRLLDLAFYHENAILA